MKKSIIVAIFTLSFLFLSVPQKAHSQSVFGLSGVGYNSTTREIFGTSATWLDFQLAWYYDPEVLGELYWQFNNEVPLDSGYGIGLSLPQYGVLIPAVVNLYSTSYLPVTLYTTYSTHFVRSYYVYDSCSGPFGFFAPCYSDPFGFSNFFGGLFGGPSFGWPGFPFNPFFFVSGRRFTLGTTQVSILTPPGPFCLPSFKSGEMMVTADGATAPPCPTPTPTPTPTPITTILEVSPMEVTPSGTEGAGPGAPKTATVTVKTQPALLIGVLRLLSSLLKIQAGTLMLTTRADDPQVSCVRLRVQRMRAASLRPLTLRHLLADWWIYKQPWPGARRRGGSGFSLEWASCLSCRPVRITS